MHTFARTKIALAVGTTLVVMAGTAQATAPVLRAANPMLANSVNAGVVDADIRELLSSTGAVNKAITIDVALTQAAVAIPAAGTDWTAAVAAANSTATVATTAGLVAGMTITSAQGSFPTDAVIVAVTGATSFTFSSPTTAVPVSAAGANAATATPPASVVGGIASANNGAVTSAAALVMGDTTPANNSVIVWAGASNAAVVPSTGATATIGNTAAGVAHMQISLPAPGATAAYRVNGATGALEYNADTTAATPTWNAVKVDIQQVAGKEIYTEADATGGYVPANDQPLVASAGTAAGNSLAPVPVVSTTSAAGGALVNGFKIDTGATITLTNANLAVKTRATNTAFPAAALPAAPTCVAATATVNGSCTVTFVGLGTLASAADFAAPVGVDAADVTFYNSTNFNTGVLNASVPWTVDGVNATKATYTNVFNTEDGLASKLADTAGFAAATDAAAFPAVNVVSDGAQVAFVKAESSSATGTTNLALTFSEPMSTLVAAGDLREIAENVLIGTDSLAALNLNAGGTLAIASNVTTAGQGVVTISGVQAADVAGKTLNINTGIALKEPNDTGYSATVAALDNTSQIDATLSLAPVQLAGGLAATNGMTVSLKAPSATAAAITATPISIAFGTDTTARAYTAPTDATKVDRIVVSFAAGKEVALNAAPAKTLADLAADTVITVTGTAGQTPIAWQFHPTAAQLAISATGDTVTITLPTAEIYSKIDSVATMKVEYRNATNNTTNSSVLVNKNATATQAAGSVAVTTASNEPVVLPGSAMAVSNSMLTQSIIGSLTSATPVSGDLVEAYVAKWVDDPVTSGVTRTINSGMLNGAPINWSGTSGSAVWGTGSGSAALEARLDAQEGTTAKNEVPGVSAAVKPGVPPTVYAVMAYGNAYVSSLSAADALADAAANIAGIEANIDNAATAAGFTGASATGASGLGIRPDGGTNWTAQGATATSAQAAIQAGVAAALAKVVEAGVPAHVVNAARTAAMAPNATVASVVSAVLGAKLPKLVVVPVTVGFDGKLSGAGVAGELDVTKSAGATGNRGLVFLSSAGVENASAAVAGAWASGVVGTVNGVANSYNLLLATEPTASDMLLKTNKGWFVLLVHKPGDATTPAGLNMLTSAHPLATNFVPFTPNLITGLGTRTTLSTDLSRIKKLSPKATNTAWALYGLGAPNYNTVGPAGHVPSFPRTFVGLQHGGTIATTYPASFWTSDGFGADVALTMKSNQVSVATEQGAAKGTMSTISPASYVPGAAAFAWKNDDTGSVANEHIDILQAGNPPAGSIKVFKGWSLVTVPSGMATAVPAAVDAVIKVGAQVTSGYTWIKATDAATTPVPSLTAGEAVFVYSNCALLTGCPIN